MIDGHTCISDDGGTPGRRCVKCDEERAAAPKIASRADVKDVYAEGLMIGMALGAARGRSQSRTYKYSGSPVSEARRILDDCTYGDGRVDRDSLIREVTKVFVELYRAEDRLAGFQDITPLEPGRPTPYWRARGYAKDPIGPADLALRFREREESFARALKSYRTGKPAEDLALLSAVSANDWREAAEEAEALAAPRNTAPDLGSVPRSGAVAPNGGPGKPAAGGIPPGS